MESPASTQSAVTRCGRFVSYAGITRETPTCSFPNAVGQSAPSVSTGSSSGSGKPLTCHSRSTHTCFAMPAGLNSRTMATTRGLCSTTSGTRTFSTRSGTLTWRPIGSRTFGEADFRPWHLGAAASGRRQARNDFRFALDDLGIRPGVALRNHRLNQLNRALDLLVGHRLDAAAVLDLHLPRH